MFPLPDVKQQADFSSDLEISPDYLNLSVNLVQSLKRILNNEVKVS